jgi:hypothetical protein
VHHVPGLRRKDAGKDAPPRQNALRNGKAVRPRVIHGACVSRATGQFTAQENPWRPTRLLADALASRLVCVPAGQAVARLANCGTSALLRKGGSVRLEVSRAIVATQDTADPFAPTITVTPADSPVAVRPRAPASRSDTDLPSTSSRGRSSAPPNGRIGERCALGLRSLTGPSRSTRARSSITDRRPKPLRHGSIETHPGPQNQKSAGAARDTAYRTPTPRAQTRGLAQRPPVGGVRRDHARTRADLRQERSCVESACRIAGAGKTRARTDGLSPCHRNRADT